MTVRTIESPRGESVRALVTPFFASIFVMIAATCIRPTWLWPVSAMGLSCAMVPEGMTDQEAQARWDAPSVLHLAFRFLEFGSRDQKIAIGRFRTERPFADGAALARASQSALRRGQALAGRHRILNPAR